MRTANSAPYWRSSSFSSPRKVGTWSICSVCFFVPVISAMTPMKSIFTFMSYPSLYRRDSTSRREQRQIHSGCNRCVFLEEVTANGSDANHRHCDRGIDRKIGQKEHRDDQS